MVGGLRADAAALVARLQTVFSRLKASGAESAVEGFYAEVKEPGELAQCIRVSQHLQQLAVEPPAAESLRTELRSAMEKCVVGHTPRFSSVGISPEALREKLEEFVMSEATQRRCLRQAMKNCCAVRLLCTMSPHVCSMRHCCGIIMLILKACRTCTSIHNALRAGGHVIGRSTLVVARCFVKPEARCQSSWLRSVHVREAAFTWAGTMAVTCSGWHPTLGRPYESQHEAIGKQPDKRFFGECEQNKRVVKPMLRMAGTEHLEDREIQIALGNGWMKFRVLGGTNQYRGTEAK
eukprot:14438478-Alexandrium_andersonii.AAC.1